MGVLILFSDIKVALDDGHLLKDGNPAAAARIDELIFSDVARTK